MDPRPEVQDLPTRATLKRFLSERNQYPERVAEIDETIRRLFEKRAAILVLDMSGFSRLTIEHGIIHYLAMIEEMEAGTRPAIVGNRGLVVKQEADNLFALFDTPADALEAAYDVFKAFEAINSVVPDSRDLYGSIGIGYGDLLIIEGEDVFGCEMNLASKLGEDLAERYEILLTEAAYDALPDSIPHRFEARTYSISDVEIHCHCTLAVI